jgi:hypothetical protein
MTTRTELETLSIDEVDEDYRTLLAWLEAERRANNPEGK